MNTNGAIFMATALAANKMNISKQSSKNTKSVKKDIEKTPLRVVNNSAAATNAAVTQNKAQPKLMVINSKPENKYKLAVAKTAKSVDEFLAGSYVVYPTHGVGLITGIEKQTIGGCELKLYVIAFEKDKMTLRVPVSRAKITGLRALSTKSEIEEAVTTLKQKAKIAKGMWSKRAQEYESKINSGSIVYLAEVVRDLHRNVDHPERSYSERVIYENAFSRLAREISVVEQMDMEKAGEKLVKILSRKAA